MSQALHRQRLRDRRGPILADSSFTPVGAGTKVPTYSGTSKPSPPQPTTVDAPEAAVVETATPQPTEPAVVVDEATVPVVQPTTQQPAALSPTDQPADTPAEVTAGEQQKTQARTTAESLAGLDTAQYTQALQDLQINQSELYPLVVDELNQMVSEQVDGEGDDFNLSGITDPPNVDT